MRNVILGRRGLSWALAAVMAVGLPVTHSVWAVVDSNTRQLLTEQLPAGVTLQRASLDQTVMAVHAAVMQRPDMATSIVQVAIMSRMSKKNPDGTDAMAGNRHVPCPVVTRIARAAITAAPSQASEITQMALSLAPDCADALNSVADNVGPEGYSTPEDLYGGFGSGFGPGFPGAPGFTGSPPSGAIALPAASATPVTSEVNG